jgi:hypothetical protein
MLALQSEVRKGLKEGTIALTTTDRTRLAKGGLVMLGALGLTVVDEDAYAAALEAEKEAAAEEYMNRERQKNAYVKYLTAEHYTEGSSSRIIRWLGTGVDFFNPVGDVIFGTDLIEDWLDQPADPDALQKRGQEIMKQGTETGAWPIE